MLILPIVCFALTFCTALCATADREPRGAFLQSSVVWGGVVTALTEALSAGGCLTYGGVAVAWTVAALAAASAAWRWRQPLTRWRYPAPRLLRAWGVLTVIGTIVLLTGLTALSAVPNNWDSMTYHMSRVMHWAQNGGVAFYPTHRLSQLHAGPWAEYGILHFYLLSAGDRFSALIQWFGMAGSLIGVSLIARQLGANVRGQLLSALFCVTIPMGILQASST